MSASVSHTMGHALFQAAKSTLTAVRINHGCPHGRELIAFGNSPGMGVCLVKDVGKGRVTDAPNFREIHVKNNGARVT